MRRRRFLNQLTSLSGGVIVTGMSGCGTVFYHERIDQPRSHDIDWKIAGLNGLGLILFFVPGVIAFIVDFYTGAIYLPRKGSVAQSAAESESIADDQLISSVETAGNLSGQSASGRCLTGKWQRIGIAPAELGPERIEQIVGKQLASPLSLSDSQTRISALSELEHYADQCQRHRSESEYGMTANLFFKKMPSPPS